MPSPVSPRDFDAVLFDLDGVLTTTRTVHAAAWKSMFDEFLAEWDAAHGTRVPRFDERSDYAAAVDGKPREAGVHDFLASRGITLPPGRPDSPPDERSEWGLGNRKQLLVEEEIAHRRQTRIQRAVSAAEFPFLRTVDEFDFSLQSSVRLTTIGSLMAPDFVTQGSAVILSGKPGRGKTHLAVAIAYRAIQNGFDALFVTAIPWVNANERAYDGLLRAFAAAKPQIQAIAQPQD